MKKVLWRARYFQVVFLVFCFVAAGADLTYASAPTSVNLAYDAGAESLSVTIDHYTASTGMHRIKIVEIKKNGTSVSKNEYDKQPTDSTFTYTYKIPAAKGDKFEVTASCNLWGSKTAALTVP
ncbi:MAG: hypothetical protein K4571_03950 [Deltaproteobacteria bacterium]